MVVYCRTCLTAVPKSESISLSGSDLKAQQLRDKLTTCVPQISSHLVICPVLCTTCCNALNTISQFKKKCLEIEEKIYKYMGTIKPNVSCIKITDIIEKRLQTKQQKQLSLLIPFHNYEDRRIRNATKKTSLVDDKKLANSFCTKIINIVRNTPQNREQDLLSLPQVTHRDNTELILEETKKENGVDSAKLTVSCIKIADLVDKNREVREKDLLPISNALCEQGSTQIREETPKGVTRSKPTLFCIKNTDTIEKSSQVTEQNLLPTPHLSRKRNTAVTTEEKIDRKRLLSSCDNVTGIIHKTLPVEGSDQKSPQPLPEQIATYTEGTEKVGFNKEQSIISCLNSPYNTEKTPQIEVNYSILEIQAHLKEVCIDREKRMGLCTKTVHIDKTPVEEQDSLSPPQPLCKQKSRFITEKIQEEISIDKGKPKVSCFKITDILEETYRPRELDILSPPHDTTEIMEETNKEVSVDAENRTTLNVKIIDIGKTQPAEVQGPFLPKDFCSGFENNFVIEDFKTEEDTESLMMLDQSNTLMNYSQLNKEDKLSVQNVEFKFKDQDDVQLKTEITDKVEKIDDCSMDQCSDSSVSGTSNKMIVGTLEHIKWQKEFLKLHKYLRSCKICKVQFGIYRKLVIHVESLVTSSSCKCCGCDYNTKDFHLYFQHVKNHLTEEDFPTRNEPFRSDYSRVPVRKIQVQSSAEAEIKQTEKHNTVVSLDLKFDNTFRENCTLVEPHLSSLKTACVEDKINKPTVSGLKNPSWKAKFLKLSTDLQRCSCRICKMQFPSLKTVHTHLLSLLKNHPYKCCCDYLTTDNGLYFDHMKDHVDVILKIRKQNFVYETCGQPDTLTHLSQLECDVCKYKATTKHNLTNHQKCHSSLFPYRCIKCRFCSKNEKSFKDHVKKHGKCFLCEYTTTSELKMKAHMLTHDKPFKCQSCKYTSFTKGSLKQHELIHSAEKLYICEVCGLTFRTSANLRNHQLSNHNDSRETYNCNLCKYKSKNPSKLKQHLRVHTGEKPYNCGFCSKKFAYPTSLREHIKIHTGETPYKCKYCSYSAIRASGVKLHVRKIHQKGVYLLTDFACDQCDYVSMYKSEVNRHIAVKHTKTEKRHRIKLKEKQFNCAHCDYQTRRKQRLVWHLRRHTGEKPFTCGECNRAFRIKKGLIRHTRTHTGVKPYHCTFCSYRAAYGTNLRAHMARHTGEKLYKCKNCDYATSVRNHLRKHVDVHSR